MNGYRVALFFFTRNVFIKKKVLPAGCKKIFFCHIYGKVTYILHRGGNGLYMRMISLLLSEVSKENEVKDRKAPLKNQKIRNEVMKDD